MYTITTLASYASLLASLPFAFAGFSSSSSSNIAIYWGQNSYGQATGGSLSQQRLSYYCSNTELDIIPLAFLTTISTPTLNFANAGDLCTAISGSSLFYCPQIEADIAECQSTYGKTILLSVGGSTYTEGGFSSTAAAVAAANNIWAIFGPKASGSTAPRPFGASVVDGFDFDFESTVSNMPAFANQLRSLMTASSASTGKTYLLSAAPQCPYPDAADGPMLAGAVSFDVIWIQFYNNYCGLQSFTVGSSTQNNFNYATWDNWAKTVSSNKNVKIMLGIPGDTTAAGSGYESGATLADIIAYCKSFSSFGGVMVWDMSQVYANSGFLSAVSSDLGAPAATASTTPTTLSTVTTSAPTGIAVPQWGQCGVGKITGLRKENLKYLMRAMELTIAGIAELAKLLNTCAEGFEEMSLAARYGGVDEILQVNVQVEQIRLLMWGQAVGISATGDEDEIFDEALEREYVRSAVTGLIICFVKIFEDSENLVERYGLIQRSDWRENESFLDDHHETLLGTTFQQSYHKFRHISLGQDTMSRIHGKWAVIDGKRFKNLIEELKSINDSLIYLLPTVRERIRVQMRTEIMRSSNEQQLRSLANASKDSNAVISETAKLRLEMISDKGFPLRPAPLRKRSMTPTSPYSQESSSPRSLSQSSKAPPNLARSSRRAQPIFSPPYNNKGALIIHKVFSARNRLKLFSWVVGSEDCLQQSAIIASNLIYIPSSLPHALSKLMDIDPETDPHYRGWAAGSISISGFAREFGLCELEKDRVPEKSCMRATSTNCVTPDLVLARWEDIAENGLGKDCIKNVGYEQVRALVGPSEFSWLDPAEGLKFRHQISDLLASLCRRRAFPNLEEVSSIGALVLRDQVDPNSSYHMIDFLYQILLAKEISMRLEKDTNNWHGGITTKVLYDMIAAEMWLKSMEMKPRVKEFHVRPSIQERQIRGLISFAEKMRWPYLYEAQTYLESLLKNEGPVGGVDIRLWDWIMGLVLPGSYFAVTLFFSLYQSSRTTKEAPAPGTVKVRQPNFGFVFPQISYWRSRSVLGRVLSPLGGVYNIGGWVGPCPGVNRIGIRTGTMVELKTRDSAFKLQDVTADESSSYQLRNSQDNTPWEEPELPATSNDLCKLQAIRLSDVPPDLSGHGRGKDAVKMYQAKLDFQLIQAKTMTTITLYANSIFVAAQPCRGIHRIDPKMKHLYQRKVLEVSDLPRVELDSGIIIVINTSGDAAEVMARAWCAQKATHAVVWKRENGCCYKCGLMMAGKEGLNVGVLILC
ncbi:hypothetical protein B7494_g957 [Chlorociboria aeruginascens]|nr:hypothetical protein B7494_g957 [Chlorociboria aeruginascens]